MSSLSQQPKLLKDQKSSFTGEKDNSAKFRSGVQKKHRKSGKSGFAESVKGLEKSGTTVAQLLATLQKEGEYLAKRSRQSDLQEVDLTGAHEEPRQAQ